MGRPKKGRVAAGPLRLHPDLIAALDEIAEARHMSRMDVINDLLDEQVAILLGQTPPPPDDSQAR